MLRTKRPSCHRGLRGQAPVASGPRGRRTCPPVRVGHAPSGSRRAPGSAADRSRLRRPGPGLTGQVSDRRHGTRSRSSTTVRDGMDTQRAAGASERGGRCRSTFHRAGRAPPVFPTSTASPPAPLGPKPGRGRTVGPTNRRATDGPCRSPPRHRSAGASAGASRPPALRPRRVGPQPLASRSSRSTVDTTAEPSGDTTAGASCRCSTEVPRWRGARPGPVSEPRRSGSQRPPDRSPGAASSSAGVPSGDPRAWSGRLVRTEVRPRWPGGPVDRLATSRDRCGRHTDRSPRSTHEGCRHTVWPQPNRAGWPELRRSTAGPATPSCCRFATSGPVRAGWARTEALVSLPLGPARARMDRAAGSRPASAYAETSQLVQCGPCAGVRDVREANLHIRLAPSADHRPKPVSRFRTTSRSRPRGRGRSPSHENAKPCVTSGERLVFKALLPSRVRCRQVAV
jgi:hypothetical protein